MSDFAAQLKSEIARIARKEFRAETKQLKKASAQYRSEMAALKRTVASLTSEVTRLNRQLRRQPVAVAKPTPNALRFRADGFASLRKRLGLSAADLGKLLGVSAQSVYHWESGKSKPRAGQLPAIAEARKLGRREAAVRLAAG